VSFLGEEKKKVHRRQTKQSPPTHVVTPKRRHGGASILTTLLKGVFKHQEVLHTSLQGHERLPHFETCTIYDLTFLFFFIYLVKYLISPELI
jgi:hypothetical protein